MMSVFCVSSFCHIWVSWSLSLCSTVSLNHLMLLHFCVIQPKPQSSSVCLTHKTHGNTHTALLYRPSKKLHFNGLSSVSFPSESFVQKLLNAVDVFYRSELENLSNNSACDVIGLVTFVGRVERVKSKGNKGKKCVLLSTNWKQLFFKLEYSL